MSRSPYYPYPHAGYPAPHNFLGMSHANTPVYVISRPMPQQPMPPLRRPNRPPKQLRSPDRRKRYGVVFASDPLQGMLDDEDQDDADSTWSMSRARRSRRMRMQSSRQASMRTRNSSPAQEIAARYRASQLRDSRPTASSSSVTFVDGYSTGWDSRPRTMSGETNVSSFSGPQLRYRDSRAHAMDRATKEAYLMAVQCGSYRNIPCQRRGCRDILPTIRDLAAHIVIHDLDPRAGLGVDPRYRSFLDMGHSVDGGRRRRFSRSSAPYAQSQRSYHKFRRYLKKLTYPCVPCYAPSDDDFF